MFELVWVDAPDPSVCGFSFGGRCCLNGYFGQQYDWRNFASGDMKKAANVQLWAQSQYNHQPSYQGICEKILSKNNNKETERKKESRYDDYAVTILSHIFICKYK